MKRVRFTITEVMDVDLPDEEADALTCKDVERLDVCEAASRARHIAAYASHHIDSDVAVEALDPEEGSWASWAQPIDGTAREKFLWSARHFVIEARYRLSLGRYREGNCPELDVVNGALAKIEDQLRLMALEVDEPDFPEVVAWRAEQASELLRTGGAR